jgi:hypothetical protein
LAGEISQDLKHFTVHDITHIDALWQTADLIVGDDYPFTPTEAFVLGEAFLLHDLGLALASYFERSLRTGGRSSMARWRRAIVSSKVNETGTRLDNNKSRPGSIPPIENTRQLFDPFKLALECAMTRCLPFFRAG